MCGAGGFIGGHLVKRLKAEGFWVRGVDLKPTNMPLPRPTSSSSETFATPLLRAYCRPEFDEVYQLAADMGGAGFVFIGDNDADIMHNSGTINFNILDACRKRVQRDILFLFGLHVSSLQSGGSRTIRIATRARPIRRLPTANTVGRSCSASGSI